LIENSQKNIAVSGVETIEDVRASEALIYSSSEMIAQNNQLKTFLRQNLYYHHKVYRMTRKAHQIVASLFTTFLEDERLLPPEHQAYAQLALKKEGESGRARIIADYIAGMPDRYAIREHRKLFGYGEVF
jgi:dGTPase